MCAKHCIGDHQILNISQGLKICIMGIFYDNLRCPVQLWLGVTTEIEYVVIRINTGICVSPNTSEY